MDLTDPAFPHGTNRGYQRGCRKPQAGQCPGLMTCSAAHNSSERSWRSKEGGDVGGAKVSYVLRRLDQTIDVAGLSAVLEHTGLSAADLDAIRALATTTMPDERAAPLDHAWSFLVHGSDTRAPDFPHGSPNGYTRRRCRCRPCANAASSDAKRRAMGYLAPGTVITDPATLKAVRRRIERLTPGAVTVHQVARAAGLCREVVQKGVEGRPLSARSVQVLMALTPAEVAAAAKDGARVPADPARHAAMCLWALGYPIKWIGERTGTDPRWIRSDTPYMTVATITRVMALVEEIGDTPASETDGVDDVQAARARRAARKAGHYPPACYDDDRRLVHRAIPGHPWSVMDERAALVILGAYGASRGTPLKTLARDLNASADTLGKDRDLTWGLTYEGSRFDPVASRARVIEIARIYHDWSDGLIGPLTGAMLLGHRFKRMWPGWAEHPELLAWNEEIDSARTDAAA